MARGSDVAEGLGSTELKRMLELALRGDSRELIFWLCRFGGQPGPRPSVSLASGFGAEAASHGDRALGVLSLFAKNVAAPDTAEVFLPIAAAYGYAQLVARGKAVRQAWAGLFELAADERAPVRVSTAAALIELCAKKTPDPLVIEAESWLAHEDRELRWGAFAVVCEVLSERRALDPMLDRDRWLAVLAGLLADLADAPRAAERSDARRRVLAALPSPIAVAAQSFRGTPSGIDWLDAQCRIAKQVDVRAALNLAIEKLRKRGGSEKVETLLALNEALASSAKPDRHAARVREGTGRGKKRKGRGN